jgi:molybdopterin converting factor small subunit
MQVQVALYGAARVIVGRPVVELAFAADAVTLAQAIDALIVAHPRVRPYLLDDGGALQASMRVLVNDERLEPDAALAAALHDHDRLVLMWPMAGGAA